jgi:chorismate mutase/prephenate dehydratase
MDLQELRLYIDEIDEKLARLFQQRMDISAEIARYKQQNNMPVYDPAREKQILDKISQKVDAGYKSDICVLYSLLFELSRARQERILDPEVV